MRSVLGEVTTMRFILVDRGKEFCDVLRWQFRSHPEVEIVFGKFEDLPVFDCVVTAGNSFGLMDAGVDLAVVKFFGRHVMERIQKVILEDHLGEQPVGTCILVPTDHPAHPFVAHAPTMRTPMNIRGTDHVYLALWAALTAVHRHNRAEERMIQSVACPGLGTGTGGHGPLGGGTTTSFGVRAFPEACPIYQSVDGAGALGEGVLRWEVGI